MNALLCRNRVIDFNNWKRVFESHAQAHRAAGLHLKSLWRGIDEPKNVFFLFELTDLEKARAFLKNPQASEAAATSGVLDGEYRFLESAPAD